MVDDSALRCPRPRGAGGTNDARFHPPPHSFRRLALRSATWTAQRAFPTPTLKFGLSNLLKGGQEILGRDSAQLLRGRDAGTDASTGAFRAGYGAGASLCDVHFGVPT